METQKTLFVRKERQKNPSNLNEAQKSGEAANGERHKKGSRRSHFRKTEIRPIIIIKFPPFSGDIDTQIYIGHVFRKLYDKMFQYMTLIIVLMDRQATFVYNLPIVLLK